MSRPHDAAWVFECPVDGKVRNLRSCPEHPPKCTRCGTQLECVVAGGRQ